MDQHDQARRGLLQKNMENGLVFDVYTAINDNRGDELFEYTLFLSHICDEIIQLL